jgi:hypothetical protein
MSASAQHGYLLLADISGYTSFVAGTELEHSHEILSDLLVAVCEKIESLMTIHKLEGDAVFAYISDSMAARGETLLELIESTYVAFRDKQVSMKRATTCTCNACRNIPSLDLKFVVHHGEYIVQRVREIRELVGSDVNLVHRLLKNHVAEATGWQAYVMFTEKSLERLGLSLENMHIQREQYEHLGEIKTFSIDLHQRYKEITEQRRILIDEKDADLVLQYDFATPPPVTWEWMQDPIKRNLWAGNVHWYAGDRPSGRAGKGASNHCAHGKSISTEVTLDWRPFEHSTVEAFEGGKKRMSETLRFDSLPDGGTRVRDIVQLHAPLPRFVRRIMARMVLVQQMKYDQLVQKAARLAAEEYNRNKETDEA